MAPERPDGDEELRRRAEALAAGEDRATTAPTLSEAEMRRLLHELQVHQIELELQNEELMQARADVESALERYTDLYDFAPAAYFTLDRQLVIRELNLAGARLLGDDRARLVGRAFTRFVAPEDRQTLAAWLDHAWLGDAAGACTVTVPSPDGGLSWVQMEADTTADRQGLRLVAVDITQRRLAEVDRERLMAAIEQAEETILITDAGGTVQYVNPRFEHLTGYSRDAAVGQALHELTSDRLEPASHRALWTDLAAGRTWHGHLASRRKDGTLLLEDATISPVRDSSGRTVSYVAVQRDITRQAEADAHVAEAQKLQTVSRLAGGIAHDFNNMLGVVLGHTELALGELPPGHPLHDGLTAIELAARRCADLTRQLLAFAREQMVMPRALDLNEAVSASLGELRRLVGDRIRLEWHPGADVAAVRADPTQIEQMLVSLCLNAREAIPERGVITIATSNRTLDGRSDGPLGAHAAGDYVLLSVSDDGRGMDAVTRAQSIEPFFTTKGVGEGSGLGLSAVYGAVKQNGGLMHIESQPGRGTSVLIHLPRDEAVETSGFVVAATAPTGPATILLVDDEPAVLALTARMLRTQGYTVLTTAGARDAIDLAQTHQGHIDLLITDVVMPDLNGPELAKHLRRVRPDLKRLFMSGYTAEIIAHHEFLADDAHFVQKPYSMAGLLFKVRAVLHGT